VQAVAIKELKNRLSAYLREVARGEVVLVTDRGRVVAELRRPVIGMLPGPSEQGLSHLHATGVLVLGLPQSKKAYRRTKVRIRVATQALLDEERGE
jgi:antitoxin (DNA-binding transcriptional repressor) of toxin-antitoxin stability system